MKRSPRARAPRAADHSADDGSRGTTARRPADASGLGRLIALARGAGNRALESVFGRHHASVAADARVRDDAEAHAVARSLGAEALTIGDTILLGEDAPPLSSPAGERLLAHELAHVAQQRAAGTNVRDAVSTAGDAHERAADAAASRAMRGESASPLASGAPPAIQRQEKLSITRTGWLTRDDARSIIQQYLERVLAQQGGKTVSMTDEVKNTLRKMFLNDVSAALRFESFIGRSIFPASPAELATAITNYLPEEIDPRQTAHLGISAQPKPTTTAGRLGDLVKKTAPGTSADQQIAEWEFGRTTKEARRNDKGVVGPFGVDLNRVVNIGRGLGDVFSPKPARKKIEPATPNPALEAAIATIDRDVLVPAEAANSARAGSFADAQEVARGLARELDAAQAEGRETAELQMVADYSGVKDRERIIGEIARIARLVRDALPHKASRVTNLDVYFGGRLARRISLAATPEAAP